MSSNTNKMLRRLIFSDGAVGGDVCLLAYARPAHWFYPWGVGALSLYTFWL